MAQHAANPARNTGANPFYFQVYREGVPHAIKAVHLESIVGVYIETIVLQKLNHCDLFVLVFLFQILGGFDASV